MNEWLDIAIRVVTIIQLGLSVWLCGMTISRPEYSRKSVLIVLVMLLAALWLFLGEEVDMALAQRPIRPLVYRALTSIWLAMLICRGPL